MPEPEEYTCAICHQTYTKMWSDEEAITETISIFGKEAASGDLDIVCDDCWRKMVGLPPADGEEHMLIWTDFKTCSCADDGEHTWIVMRMDGNEWVCLSTEYGANLVPFGDRDDAKRSCEEKAKEVRNAAGN